MDENKISSRILNVINHIDVRVLIFILLFLNTFSLKLDENEEQYFAFARAFMNHDWIPGAVSLKDVPGARIIFESIIGWVLRFATFEQVAIFGRGLVALLFAIPLARIFKKLRFNNLEAIFLLQVICALTHQSFFAKEWIFGAFETKVISYLFIFFSLSYLIDNRYFLSVLFSAFAVYFHFLVGGWYALILFFYLLISRMPLRTILGYSLTFAAVTAPFGIYLATTYLANNPNVIEGVEISMIYVYMRNPHHLDMIRQLHNWGSSAQVGVTLSFLFGILCFRLYSSNRDPIIRKLTLLSLILFSQQFLSLLIALFDKSGAYLKFYPYRTSSLSFVLMLLLLMLLFKGSKFWQARHFSQQTPAKMPSGSPKPAIVFFMIICIIAGLGIKLNKNFNESYQVISPSPKASASFALYAWIKQNTAPEAVFLDLNEKVRENLDFIRKTERDSFSVYKFVPTSNRLIYDWYQRVQEKDRVVKDLAYLPNLKQKYHIDYLVTKTPLQDKSFQLVYYNDYYYLYSSG